MNGDGTKPIQWRVLDAENANDGTTAGMFLLSEYLLVGGVYFQKDIHIHDDGKNYKGANTGDHMNCVIANVYQGSDGQAWCADFAADENNFTDTERTASWA